MSYTKTNWVDGQAPAINAANLNNLEKQYDEAVAWAKGFGLGDVAKDISGTDLNNLNETGFYKGSNLSNSPITPITSYFWFVINLKHTSTHKVQFATLGYNSGTTVYQRVNNNGTWSTWGQLLNTTASEQRIAGNLGLSKGTDYTAFFLERIIGAVTRKVILDTETGTGVPRLLNHDQTANSTKSGLVVRDDGLYEMANESGTYNKVAIQDWVKYFGLGASSLVAVADANTVTVNSFNHLNQPGTNTPPANTTGWALLTQFFSTSYQAQTAIEWGNGNVWTRTKNNGVWGTWVQMETTVGAQKKVEQQSFKMWKKNYNTGAGIYTLEEYRRKSDNTMVKTVEYTSPDPQGKMTQKVVKFYGTNGTTVEKTDTFNLVYDTNGILIRED